MTLASSHLTAAAAKLLNEPKAQRIEAILSGKMGRLPESETCARRPRTARLPPGRPACRRRHLRRSGMGKTMIMHRSRSDNPPFRPGRWHPPDASLALQMTGRPSERRLFAQFLAAPGAPRSTRCDIVDLEQAALRVLRTIGVKVLVLDEVHNILAGPHRDQRIILNILRFLTNELSFSLVCFGVSEAREAISGDIQLARRIDEIQLQRWAANKEIETLMASILRNQPLRNPISSPHAPA